MVFPDLAYFLSIDFLSLVKHPQSSFLKSMQYNRTQNNTKTLKIHLNSIFYFSERKKFLSTPLSSSGWSKN